MIVSAKFCMSSSKGYQTNVIHFGERNNGR